MQTKVLPSVMRPCFTTCIKQSFNMYIMLLYEVRLCWMLSFWNLQKAHWLGFTTGPYYIFTMLLVITWLCIDMMNTSLAQWNTGLQDAFPPNPCLYYELVSAGHSQIPASTTVHDPASVQFAAFTLAGDICPCTCRFLCVSESCWNTQVIYYESSFSFLLFEKE